ncbi:MAG: type 1 glutamine amidotransferase [Steroidobacterales bacterium]
MQRQGPRLLVIDGNVASVRARLRAALGYDTGEGYVRVLGRLDPDIAADIVCPADAGIVLPAGVALGDYDGVTMTGSALNIYDGGAAVERQIALVQAAFSVGVPFFGSCWGLQVAVSAAGGSVHRNPRGREFGFARRIQLTEAGRDHALYGGKPAVFEAPTIHLDAIDVLPAGAVVLATNDMGLQAAAFSCQRGTFWGVQYHPEYDPVDIGAVAERYGMRLVEEKIFDSEAALQTFAAEMRRLQADPHDPALVWKHGLGIGITDAATRLLEIRNWLKHQVMPRVGSRA